MTLRVLFLFCLLPLIFLGKVAAAQTQLPDTVKLGQVTVGGNRYQPYAAGTRTQPLDSLLLQRQPGLTLTDALQQRSALYLKSYGNGMTATVAFRGTTASQTAVLWNGFNIALPTLGLSDFALLPPPAHTQVSLQHGPSGALHGSGAVGGAVILENQADFSPRQSVRVQQEVSSFVHTRTAASGHFSNGQLSLTSSFTRTASQNNFRFQNTTAFGKPWEEQQNAAFRQTSFAQEAHYKISSGQRVSVRGWYVKTHRQVQPSMGSANTNAEQDDENLRLMAEWEGNIARGRTNVKAAFFKDRLDYRNSGLLSLSSVNTWQSQLEHERTLLPNLLLQAGTEFQLFKADVGGYGGQVSEIRHSAYAWLRYDPLPSLQISLNLRQAWVQGFNPPLTPTVGANLRVLNTRQHLVTLKANGSRSYRVPTLNDRFWKPGGNPNLNPESGWGYETGLVHQATANRLTITSEVTLFALRVKDWIQWQPAQGFSEPVNLSKVRGNGAEADTKWQFRANNRWSLSGGLAYAYTVSEQKLPNERGELVDRQLFYVPKHKVAGWAEVRHQGWWLTADATFTHRRFSDNDNNRSLPAYSLVNAGLGKTLAWRTFDIQALAQVMNLADTMYQTMAFHAMPPRHFRLSMALEWSRPPRPTTY